MSEKYQITGRQISAARALLGMPQADLASAARVSIATLRRMESADGAAPGMANNVAAVVAALEAAGVEFIPENGRGAGVRALFFVHTEEGTKRLLFRRRDAALPVGKWDAGRPIRELPKSVAMTAAGSSIWSPSDGDAELAEFIWPVRS